MTNSDSAVKRGYLNNDFELFHLKDRKSMQFEFHYHEFNKIVIFVSGTVTYHIEGRAYRLKPWDILFISVGEVHSAVIEPGSDYERIVLWMNQHFLDSHRSEDGNLSACFETAASDGRNLMRLNPEYMAEVKRTLAYLEEACKRQGFGKKVLKNSLFLQLIVQLDRLYLDPRAACEKIETVFDENISQLIKHINDNLDSELSVEKLAAGFFMNRYYLMHRFKQQTGYTLHNYIMNKRILKASLLLKKGGQTYEICITCGFTDYSSFVRAFKKIYGVSPKQYQKKYFENEKYINTDNVSLLD